MFSGIPLPKVVADTVPGGNILAGMQAANTYNQGRLQNQFYPQLAQAQVAQQQAQANAAPLNALATLASNKMLWGMMSDDQRSALSGMIGNSLNKMQANQQGNTDSQSSFPFGNGIIGQTINWAKNEFGKGNSPTNNPFSGSTTKPATVSQNTGTVINSPDPNEKYKVNPISDTTTQNQSSDQENDQTSPNLPQGTNIGKGIGAHAIAEGAEGVHAPAVLYVDAKGNPTYTPTTGQIGQYEFSIDSINRALPILKRLKQESKEFLNEGGRAALAKAEAAGVGVGFGFMSKAQAKEAGIDPDMVGRYNEFMADMNQAKETLKNSYVYPNTEGALEQLSSAVTPGLLNEDYDAYAKRIDDLTNHLTSETLPSLRTSLREGYNVSANQGNNKASQNVKPQTPKYKMTFAEDDNHEGQEPPKGTRWLKDDNGKMWAVAIKNVTKALAGSNGRPPLHELD